MRPSLSLRYKRINIPFFLLCIGLFLFPYALRESLFTQRLAFFNLISYLSFFYIVQNDKKCFVKNRLENVRKIKYIHFTLCFFMLISYIIVTYSRKDYVRCMMYAVTIVLPTILIDFNFRSKSYFDEGIKIWTKGLKTLSYFITICGILDLFTNKAVSLLFSNLYTASSLTKLIASNRIVSILGHSLFTSEILLIFYITYHLYTVVYNSYKEKMINFLIALIGIALTGSKTGIVLLLLYFILTHANWKNRKILSSAIIVILILYWIGVFDTVLERIFEGILSGDITTNRNSSLEEMLLQGRIDFGLFRGRNIDYGTWELVAALEYPILRWAYQFGIMIAILLTVLLFILPLVKLLCVKANFSFLFGFLAIVACVNTYNGMALATDHVLVFTVASIFLVNMAVYKNKHLNN